MKKAIFFTIDGLVAISIIITTILLFSQLYRHEYKPSNIEFASLDTLQVFSSIQVGKVNNEYVQLLILQGEITNINNTIIEQIAEFKNNQKNETALNMTKNLTENFVSSAYGFSLLINEEEVYSRNVSVKKSLVSSKGIVSGTINNTLLWGPMVSEVRVWE